MIVKGASVSLPAMSLMQLGAD